MTIDTDFHSHVVRSSARQMALMAHRKDLRVLGLSEHVFQMQEVRPLLAHMPLEGPILSLAQYREAVQAAGEDLNIEVRLGLEVDFIPEKNEQIQALLQAYPWDYLIGSVHQIDGILFEQGQPSNQAEGEALWHRYMQLLQDAVKSGCFSVVSHPVRMRSQNPYLPPDLDDELATLAALAAEHNVALEVNGYDVLFYSDVVERLIRACAQHGAAISVGSDAHNPKQLAQAHVQTAVLLQKAGIHTIRIWQQRQIEEYQI